VGGGAAVTGAIAASAAAPTAAISGVVSANVLPLSFWASGGYWDLSALSGSDNAAISSGAGALTSLSNSALLVPSTTVAPKLGINAVGGKNAARTLWDSASGANFQYFTCNALSALFRGSPTGWTIFMHTRQDKSGDMPLWSALRSDGISTEQLFGQMIGEHYVLQKNTPGGGLVTQTAARHPDPYSDTLVAWVFDGTNVTIYTRPAGQTTTIVDSLGALDINALSAAVNRFTFCASVSSVPFNTFTGYVGKMGASALAASSSQIAALFDGITGTNYVATQVASPNISTCGASRTMCTQDIIGASGWRDILSRFIYTNGLSWYTYAQGVAGFPSASPPFRIGVSGNTFCSGASSQDCTSISNQAVLDIINSPGPTRLWVGVLSDQDANLGHSVGVAMANAKAACIAIMNAGLARDPLFRIAPFDSPPLQDATENALIGTYHTAYAQSGGLWDQLDALYPSNKVFRPSWWTIENGTWTVADWGADTAHLNHFGCLKGGHVLLNSRDADGTIFGVWLRAQSPSAARPPALSGSIMSLSNGFSLPHGTPVTLTVDSTRVGFNANVTAGSNSGVAVPAEIYDSFPMSGGYSKALHPQSTFTFTPSVGDIGPMTISVTFTDVDGVTTATASITGTVT